MLLEDELHRNVCVRPWLQAPSPAGGEGLRSVLPCSFFAHPSFPLLFSVSTIVCAVNQIRELIGLKSIYLRSAGPNVELMPRTVLLILQLCSVMALAMIIIPIGVPLHCCSDAEKTSQPFIIYFTVTFSFCLE